MHRPEWGLHSRPGALRGFSRAVFINTRRARQEGYPFIPPVPYGIKNKRMPIKNKFTVQEFLLNILDNKKYLNSKYFISVKTNKVLSIRVERQALGDTLDCINKKSIITIMHDRSNGIIIKNIEQK